MSEQWPPAHGLPKKSRMIPPPDLKWGQTSFDNLDRGELLRLVQAYHAALQSASACLKTMRNYSLASGYWEAGGSGGRALTRADYLMRLAGDGNLSEDSESIYRNFFRYGVALLFPQDRDFDRWGINDKGFMCAPFDPSEGYRAIEWSDILPPGDAFDAQTP